MADTKIEIEITRDPIECCSTYFDTARMIAACQHPVGSQEWKEEVEAHIKRYGHQEKLGVYSNLKHGYLDMGLTEKFYQDSIIEFVDIKVETHRDFCSRPNDMMIYGRGKWIKGT